MDYTYPADHALAEVIRAAELADHAANGVGKALHDQIVAAGEDWACERGLHRLEHIEQIERVLSRGQPSGILSDW